jgi:hypothetical protein
LRTTSVVRDGLLNAPAWILGRGEQERRYAFSVRDAAESNNNSNLLSSLTVLLRHFKKENPYETFPCNPNHRNALLPRRDLGTGKSYREWQLRDAGGSCGQLYELR